MHRRVAASAPLVLLLTLFAAANAPRAALSAEPRPSLSGPETSLTILPAGLVQTREQDDVATTIARVPPPDSDYVLPVVEVRALRALSEPDLRLIGWFDAETHGVYRYWREGAIQRVALDLSWMNPFNW